MTSATAGRAGHAGWTGRRTLIAALAVSLVLNLFFIAGALWTRIHPSALTPAERSEPIAKQLDLDQQQRAAFRSYRAAGRARGDKMRQQIAPLIDGAWEEMGKPQPDQATITQRFDEASRRWRDIQQESTSETLQFLATLRPDQRRKFVSIVRERRALRQHQQRPER